MRHVGFVAHSAHLFCDLKRASDQRNRRPAGNRLFVLVDPTAKAVSTFVRFCALKVPAINANGR